MLKQRVHDWSIFYLFASTMFCMNHYAWGRGDRRQGVRVPLRALDYALFPS